MADRLDELVQDAARSGASATLASIHAAGRVLARWLDMVNVETGLPGLNEETVVVGPQTVEIELAPGTFVNWEGTELPADVHVEPEKIEPGSSTLVRLWVAPVGEVMSGTYTGALLRKSDLFELVSQIGIYVIGDSTPPPSE